MKNKLVLSKIIQSENKEFFLINKDELERQKKLALEAKDQEALDILLEISQGEMKVEKKDLKGVVLSTQDIRK